MYNVSGTLYRRMIYPPLYTHLATIQNNQTRPNTAILDMCALLVIAAFQFSYTIFIDLLYDN